LPRHIPNHLERLHFLESMVPPGAIQLRRFMKPKLLNSLALVLLLGAVSVCSQPGAAQSKSDYDVRAADAIKAVMDAQHYDVPGQGRLFIDPPKPATNGEEPNGRDKDKPRRRKAQNQPKQLEE